MQIQMTGALREQWIQMTGALSEDYRPYRLYHTGKALQSDTHR